jgi:hypothetical protein
MRPSKRHAKPTALQLAERSYRHALSFKRTLLNQMAHIRLDISQARREDREHIVKLIDHCARLLREKETLMRQVYAVKELKDEVSQPLSATAYSLIHAHPYGVQCNEKCSLHSSMVMP